MQRPFFIVVLSVTLAMAGAIPAAALELFGRCLIGPCDTQADRDAIAFLDPVRYEVDLTVIGEDSAVKNAVRAASRLWTGRKDAVGASAGLITRAHADYTRIVAALYNQAHYGGSVSIIIDGREAANLGVGEVLSSSPKIEIIVQPGPAYIFGATQIENVAPPQTRSDSEQEPSRQAEFVSGAPARASIIKKAGTLEVDAWRAQGHALARIKDQRVTALHVERTVNAKLAIDPGPVARFGRVSVIGTQRMKPGFVARQTGLIAGQTYSPSELVRARKRIERLGVFSVTHFAEADTLDADGALPIVLTVEERKLRRIGLGATYSNFDGFGTEAFWLHRNLFGRAERLRIDAAVGGFGATTDYKALTYDLGIDFTKPGLWTPDTDFNAKLYGNRQTNDTYIQTTLGGQTLLRNFWSDTLTVEGGLFAEASRFEDPDGSNERQFNLFGGIGAITWDGRDNSLDPTRGLYLTAELRPFYELEHGNAGVRLQSEVRAYQSLDPADRFVLAGRFGLGTVFGPSASDIPDNMLFLAGGGGSVRGYGYQNIAVSRPDGTTRGGLSKAEASLEIRSKLTRKFGAVLFTDAASVSDDASLGNIEDWRIGVGAGVRYHTGLGPLRLDMAVPLDRQSGDPEIGIYAGIGQAF